LIISSNRIEKALRKYTDSRDDIKNKLDNLRIEPRRANGTHPLHGKLQGKWAWF